MPFLKKFKACAEWKRKEQITYKSGFRHTVYFLNGNKHVGVWQCNRREGKGSEITQNGYFYEGDFSNELRHGHGRLSRQQDDGSLRLVYSGEWRQGKRHGWGIGRRADGSWYEGSWREGRLAGAGRMWMPDGSFYHGRWLDDHFQGQGILVYPNGNCYEGEFYSGLKHGQGRFFHLDSGHLQEGVWNEGVCVSSVLRPTSRCVSTAIPPIEVLNPDAVAEESQNGALKQARSKSTRASIGSHSIQSEIQ